MQIEAGKYYRTRDGRKAFVAAVIPQPPEGFSPRDGSTDRVRGYIRGESNLRRWNVSGKIYSNDYESSYDLIAPWVDLPTADELVTRWWEYDRLGVGDKAALLEVTGQYIEARKP